MIRAFPGPTQGVLELVISGAPPPKPLRHSQPRLVWNTNINLHTGNKLVKSSQLWCFFTENVAVIIRHHYIWGPKHGTEDLPWPFGLEDFQCSERWKNWIAQRRSINGRRQPNQKSLVGMCNNNHHEAIMAHIYRNPNRIWGYLKSKTRKELWDIESIMAHIRWYDLCTLSLTKPLSPRPQDEWLCIPWPSSFQYVAWSNIESHDKAPLPARTCNQLLPGRHFVFDDKQVNR